MEFIPNIKIDPEVLKKFRKRGSAAILGKDFLEKNKDKYPWEPGGTYVLTSLGGVSIDFVGIFESDNPVYNTIILTGRRYLQEIDNRLGICNQVYIKLHDSKHVASMIKILDKEIPEKFPYKVTTVDQRAFLTAAVDDLKGMVELSHWIIVITLCVILVAVANTISMATRDRVQEIGILRSLGFLRHHVITLVLGESMVLAMVGGLLGLAIAVGVMNFNQLDYGIRGMNMRMTVSLPVAAYSILISFVVGLVGGIIPAISASRFDIVSSLRNVD